MNKKNDKHLKIDGIHYDDDVAIATIVTACLDAMKGYGTVTKMTSCYNLTESILRLFVVSCKKEDVLKLMEAFHIKILDSIEEYYE